jgi:outer membrane biosynthesis protein TonB
MFPIAEESQPSVPTGDAELLRDVATGKYDDLFQGAPDKPSDLYRAAQIRPPSPSVRLVSSEPFAPETFVEPVYPAIARLARLQGTVCFDVEINGDRGEVTPLSMNGPPMLYKAAEAAVTGWRFPVGASGQTSHVVLEFKSNCPL